MSATLASEIRSHEGSLGERVLMQLTGPNTRPQVFIVNSGLPLGHEQRAGITTHRASSYSAGLS
jgi:hypothetical protein